ncbi:zf-HC2 domain-containing protein [Streptomyces synnematoformans]|uniref:Zinc-finger domain-containing protein n=1 Tax=Streptomyces synnematoformans TaxID=415721 RepID=A0ABP5JY97_9ACTN
MTQTPQPPGAGDGHPEVDELADFAEGLTSPARSRQLHRHLDECAACRETREALDGVRGLLGSLPEPSPMPAEIAGRIDAALAAEARYAVDVSRETASADSPVPAPRESVSRETRPARAHRRPAAHRRADATGPGRRTRRWPRVLLGAAGAVAVVTLSIVLLDLPDTGGDDAGTSEMSAAQDGGRESAQKSVPGGGGGGDQAPLSADSLESHVLGMLPQPETREGTDAGEGAAGVEEGPFAAEEDPPQVPECVRAAVNRSEAPLAAENDTYEGTRAYVVVLPHPGDPQRVDAYVVDSSCTASPDRPGEILHRDTFRRP